MNPDDPIFTEADVIFSYTDAQALEDGILVAVNTKDRVTRTVFEWLAKEARTWEDPPASWPIDLLHYVGTLDYDGRALAAVKGLIAVHGAQAREIYDKNVGGGVWGRYYDATAKRLQEEKPDGDHRRLWLLPNELGGMTLMFAEDY